MTAANLMRTLDMPSVLSSISRTRKLRQVKFLAAHRVLDEGDGLRSHFSPRPACVRFPHTVRNELLEFILGVEYVCPYGPGYLSRRLTRECGIHLFGLNVLDFIGKEICVLCDEVLYLCIFEFIDFPGSSTQVPGLCLGAPLHDYGDKLAPSSVSVCSLQ